MEESTSKNQVFVGQCDRTGDHTLLPPFGSRTMTVNWDFEQCILLTKSFKPDKKDSNSDVLWLGDLYTTATYPFLFCNVTSQTRHSVKDVFTTHNAKNSVINATKTTSFGITWRVTSN